ncbi:hypothetical protein F5Y14DRAFT_34345 [Nemania sp. NC0429]|nr:hypothetical protein F5Y14DRAFT_34345 [Nemania sp. NC0429]
MLNLLAALQAPNRRTGREKKDWRTASPTYRTSIPTSHVFTYLYLISNKSITLCTALSFKGGKKKTSPQSGIPLKVLTPQTPPDLTLVLSILVFWFIIYCLSTVILYILPSTPSLSVYFIYHTPKQACFAYKARPGRRSEPPRRAVPLWLSLYLSTRRYQFPDRRVLISLLLASHMEPRASSSRNPLSVSCLESCDADAQ